MSSPRSKPPVHRVVIGAICATALAVLGSGLAQQTTAAGTLQPDGAPLLPGIELAETAVRYFPSDDKTAPPRRIFRLTRDQLDASLAALLPSYVAQSVKTVMPGDPLQTNYEHADLLALNAANIGALSGFFAKIAERVREKPSGVIDCPGAKPSPDCLKGAARRFLVKAFRGDASEETIDRITRFFLAGVESAGHARATAELVEVTLNSPGFLFRSETDVSRSLRLAPAQLLQAVTYTLADAPPETLGLQSDRADQYLRSGAEASATIRAILGSKEAREKLVRFFKAWLEIKEPTELTISQSSFPELTPPRAAALIDSAERFLRAELAKPAPRLRDITQTSAALIEAAVDGLDGNKEGRPETAKAASGAPATRRLGILSHPAVIASHSGPTGTRPIKRGVFWARKVLCLELEPPPKDLHAKLYDLAGVTERQRIEQSTRGAACAGCHKVINPLGFFLENYDALGRWRTEDNGQPVDARIEVGFLGDEPQRLAGPVEALRAFTASDSFNQCFVRQMFRFYMGRMEEPSDDPLLRRLFLELAGNKDQEVLGLVFLLSASDRIVRRQ